MGSILGPNRVIAKDVKSCTYCCYVRYATLTVATQYHAQLGLSDKGRAIKVLVVCNYRDLEPLDLQNGLALGCYQLSPEVLLIVSYSGFDCRFTTRMVNFTVKVEFIIDMTILTLIK